MSLKELRLSKKLTQKQVSEYLGIAYRTYVRYENDENKIDSIKYKYMIEKLGQYGFVDEEHGILQIDDIKTACAEIFKNYNVNYCYLFGSYAKGTATEKSDVDLLVCADITGMKFYGLVEELRENLKKKVDVLNQEQIKNNDVLVNEILKDGVKIYG